MSNPDLERLRSIKTFPQLIKYLRDELEWPIEFVDEDKLTFDYTSEELGLDPKTAAKVEEIKQLRPFTVNQPWGVFFIKFEPKHLPVVVLRRVLQALVVKRRTQVGKAHKASWRLNDLLFISSYGESGERAISFAHFCEPPEERKDDLPTLHVLGWDGGDTVLHIDHVHRMLKEKLIWREEFGRDPEKWRETWSEPFTIRHREVISTSKELALKLADLAKGIRKRAAKILEVETDAGPLRKLHKAFQESLIHDLSHDDFADMYAQTIAYGLLAARVTRQTGITADDLHASVPITNPFLKGMLEAFLTEGGRKGKFDFDQLGVQEVVELLNSSKTNMDAVLRDFGNMNPQEDPVIHFYELFLKEYDNQKKASRGVFYTPKPVVSYIVRSVHELLKKEFGLEDGLADTTTWGEMAKRHKDLKIPEDVKPDQAFVQILDPATGTATFLVFVIDVIHQTMMEKWAREGKKEQQLADAWNDYVPKHLLPRLFGYELMMAPYAIAHMKIGLKLLETGYCFSSKERVNVYLTNALEPPSDKQLRTSSLPALAHEAQAVNEIKRKQRFTVVIGNPPYSGISANMHPSMRALIDPYRTVDGKAIKEKGALQFEKNLNDDYVKFMRYAESQVERFAGVVGMITNNAYLESATLRGLRSHLLNTFYTLAFLDLHGDSDRHEITQAGQSDENVFEIKHGVVVATMVKRLPSRNEKARKGTVYRFDLKASRQEKYCMLLANTQASISWTILTPRFERYLFKAENAMVAKEYESFVSIADLLGVNSTGFESGRDEILTAFSREELRLKLHTFCSEPAAVVRSSFNVAEAWGAVLFDARKGIEKDPAYESRFREFLFGPFDVRWCFYRKDLLKTNSFSAGKHLCYGRNMAIMVMRQVSLDSGFTHFGISSLIVNNRCFYSTKGKVSYFPIFLYSGESDLIRGKGDILGTNLRTAEMNKWAQALGLKWIAGGADAPSLKGTLTAMDATRYVCAALHSTIYRSRYEEFLRIDFPRVPMPNSLNLFQSLVRLGGELVALHLMESPKLDHFITIYTGPKNPEVGRVGWSDDTVWLDAAATKKGQPATPGTVGFHGVSEAVWNVQIGGYQVCEKWLKDRKGRKLSKADIDHYQKIVVALSETIRLMAEIDKVIDKYGGWPKAFENKSRGTHDNHTQ